VLPFSQETSIDLTRESFACLYDEPSATPEQLNSSTLTFPVAPVAFTDQQSPIVATGATPSITHSLQMIPSQSHLPLSPVSPQCQVAGSNTDLTSTTGAFFALFYHSHPSLLPQTRLLKFLEQKRLPHLESAIQYIGSIYIPSAPTESFKQSVDELLSTGVCRKTDLQFRQCCFLR